jgi:hypothetical protein
MDTSGDLVGGFITVEGDLVFDVVSYTEVSVVVQDGLGNHIFLKRLFDRDGSGGHQLLIGRRRTKKKARREVM